MSTLILKNKNKKNYVMKTVFIYNLKIIKLYFIKKILPEKHCDGGLKVVCILHSSIPIHVWSIDIPYYRKKMIIITT